MLEEMMIYSRAGSPFPLNAVTQAGIEIKGILLRIDSKSAIPLENVSLRVDSYR